MFFKVLRIVRICPQCHKSVEDLLSHYEHSHGTWNEEDKRAYLTRERQRIEKSEIRFEFAFLNVSETD